METYPSLRPLPKPEPSKLKEVVTKGQIRIADWNRKAFAQQFKKEK